MRGRLFAAIALVSLPVIGVSTALATTQPTVLYKPPVVKMLDHEGHNSVENMVVGQDGDFLLFSSTPVMVALNPESDPGCDIDVAAACSKKGIKKVVLILGAMNDSGQIRLDDPTADKVKQVLKGQGGEDELTGGRGIQKLRGGSQDDTLHGGPGPDLLIGGKGTDICDGGPGRDEFIGCEAAPAH